MNEAGKGAQGNTIPMSVYVTAHARRRMRERFPELRALTNQELNKLASQEVSWAIRAGRVAKNEPRWLVRHSDGRRGKTHLGRGQYVWNAGLTRAYICVRQQYHDQPQAVVKTAFAAATTEKAA